MSNFFLLNQLLFSLNTVIGLWLAFWVYFAGREKKVNKLFFWMVFLWVLGETTPYFVFRNFHLSRELLSFLPKLEVAFIYVFMAFFYFFTVSFLKEEKKFTILNKVVIIMAGIGIFLSIFTNLFQKEVLFTEDGVGLDLILTLQGKIGWLLYVFILTSFIFSRFLINYFKGPKENRTRVQYFLVGISFWVIISLIFVVYFPLVKDTFRYAYFGNYSILFLFGFTAYAIVKRELFGIRVVLTALLVSVIAILLALDIFVFTDQLLVRLYKGLVLVIFLYFGYALVRSVIREIEYRERIKKAYEVEKKARAALQNLDQVKNQFIMASQHHLRTPLTAMIGYVDLMLGGTYGAISHRIKPIIFRFQASTKRLIRIINEFLDISQFQLGKKVVFLEPDIEVEPIIKEIVDELRFMAEAKGIYLKLEKPKEKIPKIKADPEKLKVALFNIFDNSIKYTNKGSVTIKFKITDSKLQIITQDTGIGITEEQKEKLFGSLFERGETAQKVYTTGRGIGLFVSARIFEAHNGKIWVESEGKDKGSTFYIELPSK